MIKYEAKPNRNHNLFPTSNCCFCSVIFLVCNIGSQFLVQPCPSKGARYVSIRHLRDDWNQKELPTTEWLVCLDTIAHTVELGSINTEDPHPYSRYSVESPQYSCCFVYSRDKWFPNSVSFAGDTTEDSLYIQRWFDYEQLTFYSERFFR